MALLHYLAVWKEHPPIETSVRTGHKIVDMGLALHRDVLLRNYIACYDVIPEKGAP